MWNTFCSKGSEMALPVAEDSVGHFTTGFGGKNVKVTIPLHSVDELTGSPFDHDQLQGGMRTEVELLERLKVGSCLVEREGRQLEREACVCPHLQVGVDPKDSNYHKVSNSCWGLRYRWRLCLEFRNLRSNVIVRWVTLCLGGVCD